MISLHSLLGDTIETSAGLIVPTRSADVLIKAEAERIAKEKQQEAPNTAAFFSQFVATNMISYGAREKPAGTPQFVLLYEAARKSFIDAILIQARMDQQKRIWQKAKDGKSKEIGFRVVHERDDDKDYKVTKNDKERCREMEAILNNPTPQKYTYLYPHEVRPHHNLKDLAAVLTRAELIIDRKCIMRYPRADNEGYVAFHWLPGETIKNVDESIKAWARKNEKDGKVSKNTIDKMSLATGFDLANATYVQIVDGMVVHAFTEDEISVHISNPSDELNRWGYGVSRLEISLDITTTLLLAWTYNREIFKTNYPEQVLAVAGDFDKPGLAAFKQQILGEGGGPGQNWRLPVIPYGDIDKFKMESIKLRESPKDMLFDQMIELAINLKAAAYGAHPSTLNLSMYAGTSGQNSIGGINNTADIEFSKEHGLIPSLSDMTEWLTEVIVKPRYDDLKLVVVGLNPEDEKQAVDIRTSRVSKWLTKNEARKEEGLEPIGDENDPENPWNFPADVPIPNYLNTFSMLDQQQQQGEQEDGQQGQDQGDDDQYYKSLRKSRQNGDGTPPRKFLQISLDDQL